MNWLRFGVVFSVAATATLAVSIARAGTTIVGKVVGIQDGDTLTVLDLDLKQHRIRLTGIDAPERGQPFSHVSMDHLSTLCFGMLVTANCPKVDQYGRLVCTVFVDGKDVNLAQVTAGMAWHYKRFEQEQSVSERQAYAGAEEAARSRRAGLWQDPNPAPPWEWRALKRTTPMRNQ